MIFEAILDLIFNIINAIPFSLPQVPNEFQTILNMLFDGIHSALGLINAFIDLEFWLSCAVVMLIITNIKHIWNGIIWCLNLIPGVEITYWS